MRKRVLKKSLKDQRIMLKLSERERAQIQANADMFTEGNLSEWIRYASINMTPKKSDLTPET